MDNQDKISYSDNVFMGDVKNISNQIDINNRVTCPQCQASGNLTIFVCQQISCQNKFCEFCVDEENPKFCAKCAENITSELEQQRLLELKIIREREEKDAIRLEQLRKDSISRYNENLEKEREKQEKLVKMQKRIQKKELIEKAKKNSRSITIAHIIVLLFLIPLTLLLAMENDKNITGSSPNEGGFLPYIYIFSGIVVIVSLSLLFRMTRKNIPIPNEEKERFEVKLNALCEKYLRFDALGVFLFCLLYWFFAFWIILAIGINIYSIIGTILGNILLIFALPIIDEIMKMFPESNGPTYQTGTRPQQPFSSNQNSNYQLSGQYQCLCGYTQHASHYGGPKKCSQCGKSMTWRR